MNRRRAARPLIQYAILGVEAVVLVAALAACIYALPVVAVLVGVPL